MNDYKKRLRETLLDDCHVVMRGRIKELDKFCLENCKIRVRVIEDEIGTSLVRGNEDFILSTPDLERFCEWFGTNIGELMGMYIVFPYSWEQHVRDKKRRGELKFFKRTQKYQDIENIVGRRHKNSYAFCRH